MSTQGVFKNIKERLWKNSKKRQKLGEDEDDWCDALNYLSLDSDDEYFDAQEEQYPIRSLHTGTKRKKSGRKPAPKKESEMSRHSAQCYKPYMSGLESKTIDQPRQGSQLQSNSGVFRFGLQDSSPSTPKNTYPLGDEGYNTASSFSSQSDVQARLKWSPTMTGYADKGGISDSNLEKLAKALMVEDHSGRSLGLELGFSRTEVYRYCGYVKPKDSSEILHMLRAWKDKTPYAKQISGLLEALRKANLRHLADDLDLQKGGISDSKLEKLAKDLMGDDYHSLGQKLGFSRTDVDRYCGYGKQKGSSGILRMLRAWKDKTPYAKQISGLLEALSKANLRHLADHLHSQEGKLEKRKVTVTLMTSWHLSSIEGLTKKLKTLQGIRPDLIEAVKVLPLPFSRLHDFTFTEDVDIMVLCHSIVNRRFGITNVTDSLYDEFLDYCNKKLGKERIVVIAHDFRQEKDEVRAVTMNTFKHTQWSTFEKAGLVMICGMMDKTPEIQEKDWKSLVKFLEDASKSTPTIADISQTTHLKKGTSDTKRKPFESEKEKKDSNISSKPLWTSSGRAGGMKTRFRKPVIYICTSWGLDSIRGLKEKLKTLLEKSFSRYEIREQELPYSRLEDYKFPSEVDSSDAMILCHSVQNRGFSITDVQNSIYDEFLKLCNRVFGRGHMAVIIHDFEDKPEILKVHLETIRRTQPTTYELADLVALAGLLDDPDVKLCHDKSTSLETFVKRLF